MYTTVIIAVTCSHLLSKSDSNIYKSSSSLYVITPIITSVFQVLPSVHSSCIHPAPHLEVVSPSESSHQSPPCPQAASSAASIFYASGCRRVCEINISPRLKLCCTHLEEEACA
jgi:hypothetical protein